MRSDADDIDSYLAEVPADRRALRSEMREVCGRLLAGFDESMCYGMPPYSRDGIAEIAWASQRRYISLYVMRADVLDSHREQLAGLRGAFATAVPLRSTSSLSSRCLLPSPRATALSADRSRPVRSLGPEVSDGPPECGP